MQAVNIPIEQIRPCDENPNVLGQRKMNVLKEEIKSHGVVRPIIVRKVEDGYIMVDGEHRWIICKELGYEEIPAYVLDVSEEEGKLLLIQLNNIHGSLDKELKENLIKDILAELPYEEIKKRLRMPKSLAEKAAGIVHEENIPEPEQLPQDHSMTFVVQLGETQLRKYKEMEKGVGFKKLCLEFIERV